MSEENKKTSFFRTIFKSIKDLDKYEDFALEQPKTALKYLLKLVLIFTIIITLFYSYKMLDSLNNIYSNLINKLPEFSYSEGTLKVDSEKPIIIEEYANTIGKVIIDTNIGEGKVEKYKDEIDSLALLLLKDKVIITSNETSGQVMYSYSEIANSYGISEFTKQDVINYMQGISIISIYFSIYFVIFIYLFIVYFISIFIDVLMLSILAYIIARISRIKLKFIQSFNIAVHSITLPALLNLIYIVVNLLTGFNIRYFQLMYNTISYIYIIVAILMIKTDFINRQMELIKLAEEQEKVKEELRKQKEEEKKKEDKEDKEKQKKKEPKQDDGELQEGVNPSVIQGKE